MWSHNLLSRLLLVGIVFVCKTIGLQGVNYGPSLTSLTGVYVSYKGPSIFALDAGKKIRLEDYPNYSVIIPLTTGSSQASSDQIFMERIISTVGEFLVEAPENFGIIATIQELNLRPNSKERGGPCNDYIQFGETEGDRNNIVTGQICGVVERGDKNLNPNGLISPRTFSTLSNKMRMVFNHAYVSELVDSLLANGDHNNPGRNPTLRVEVAFTAFTDLCESPLFPEEGSNDTITTTTTSSSDYIEGFRHCASYKNKTCINSNLFCDASFIYNCGGEDSEFGSDEENCGIRPSTTTTQSPIAVLQANRRRNYYNNRDRDSYFLSSFNNGDTQYPVVSASPKNFHVSMTTSSSNSDISTNKVASVINPQVVQSVSSNNNNDNDYNSSANDLTKAVTSVIYGVALFIIFTVAITISFVCITKKIQMSLSRNRNSNRVGVTTTQGISPSTRTTVITHNSNGGNNSRNGSLSPANTTVVLLTLPQLENYDLPPTYQSLYPDDGNPPTVTTMTTTTTSVN